MSVIEAAIEVEVPVQTAYNQWTQFEEFPQFMEGVEEVRQVDETHLHWSADIAGVHREWDAEIIQQVPDQVIAWRSTDGTRNAGLVSFRPVSGNATEVKLELEIEPEGAAETIGEKMGLIKRRAEGDMSRFKELIESRGVESGGWRGEV